MYTQESDGCFVSVFDQKGNEIYNTEYMESKYIFSKLKTEQNITIDTLITDCKGFDEDDSIAMIYINILPGGKVDQKMKFVDKDKPIANESFHGYGLNRYLHRQFLKLTR